MKQPKDEPAPDFATRLRRFIAKDPFDRNKPLGPQEMRIERLSEHLRVEQDVIRRWALGQSEPAPQQKNWLEITMHAAGERK